MESLASKINSKVCFIEPVEVFKILPKKCHHVYGLMKRRNDIKIGKRYFRQCSCKICGDYRFEISIKDYHPLLKTEVIEVYRR